MFAIRDRVWGVVAGAVGVIALCIPTDLGSELSATGRSTAVHAQPDQVMPCERAQSVEDEHAGRLVARLDFTRSGAAAPKSQTPGSNATIDEPRAAPLDRRRRHPADVSATLPASAAPSVLPSAIPAAPKLSVATIRAIQRELTRHGCYAGAVDGDWGPASRYAAATFIEAVNARLPVDRPDEVLLALSRHHHGAACKQGSRIVTASTTSVGRATVMTDGLSDRGGSLTRSARVSPYAPRLTGAPRIVRASGASSAIDLTNMSDMSLPPPGEMDQRTRMALGVERSASRPETNPVTRDSATQQKRDASAAARARQRQTRKRASRQRWKRQVFQNINLSGS